MQPAERVLLTVLSMVLAGCSAPAGDPSSEGQPEAISLDRAAALIGAHVRQEQPEMAPGAAFPLRDTTSPEVWRRLGVQVFRVIGEVQQFETFVVSAERVRRIGAARGGTGVVSFCAADVNRDGRDDLAYSYAVGTDAPGSRIAWAALGGAASVEHVAPQVCTREEPLRVREAEDGTVRVLLARTVVGTLRADGESNARIEFAPGVSADVLRPRR